LTDSGLGFINRRGRQQDAFRNRVLFPVFDAQGAAVGFGGRILPDGDGPKYKNSSESTVYAKSRLLYGLNWAKGDIVQADEVIVCEGYTDVIGFATAGLGRAVATCGTALTEEHVKLLRRFARRVVLAFDADAAGQNAAARFYEWEKAHDLDVAVADLPDDADPGDLAQSDPERLVDAISGARPFLEFRVERALAGGDLSSAEGRARTAESALAMVREHPDPLVRDQYAVSVASRCRLELDLVRTQLAKPPTGDGADGTAGRRSTTLSGRRRPRLKDSPEFEALKLSVHRRDEIAELLIPELFSDELCATTYDLLHRSDSLHDAIEQGGPEVAELVQRLSVDESQAEPMDVAALLWVPYLERLMEESSEAIASAEPSEQIEIFREHKWLKLRQDDVREPTRQAGAIADLLAWVGDPVEEGI
jgi:DNA primase